MRNIRTDRTIISLAFSPDGSTLASGGWKHTALWDLASGQCTEIRQAVCSTVPAVIFSDDGSHLIWLCRDPAEIRTAKFEEGAIVAGHSRPSLGAREIAVLPGGKILTVSSGKPSCLEVDSLKRTTWHERDKDGAISIWQSPRGLVPIMTSASNKPAASLLPDGTPIAQLEDSGFIVRRIGERRPAFVYDQVRTTSLAFTPDGRHLLACCRGEVCVWETERWRLCDGFNWDIGHPECIAVSPDGLTAAASGYVGEIIQWDLDF